MERDSSPASGASQRVGTDEAAERTGSSLCHVVHDRGSREIPFDAATLERLLSEGGFFWVDLDRPTTT